MKDVNDVVSEIEHVRDELKLQSHLFKAEVKDSWVELEEKWHKLSREVKPAVKAVKKASSSVNEANKLLLSEIKERYNKIKHSL